MDYITYLKRGQRVILPAEEVMPEDQKFPWRERKVKTVRLAELYEKAGFPDYAERARTCSTWLQYAENLDASERRLQAANFCQLRLCPLCTARRAKRSAYKLSRILDLVEQEHGAKFIFLTLTMRNVPGPELGSALTKLTGAWNKLLQHRQVARSIEGWFRAIEITRGDDRWHRNRKTGELEFRPDRGYHAHIHAVMAVKPEYFSPKSGLYITQKEWIERWGKCLGTDYKPSVRIQTAKGKGEVEAGRAAASEAAKYATKDDEYIDPEIPEDRAVEILTDYTRALRGRRMTAFGGWMREVARRLDAENLEGGDLVKLDEDGIREDVLELIVTYHWHFGAGDYILARREDNPARMSSEAVI